MNKLCKCGNKKDVRAIQCVKCAWPEIDIKLLENLIPKFRTFSEITNEYNKIQTTEISRLTITRRILENKFDISHFKGTRSRVFYTPNNVCTKNSIASRSTIKQVVLKHKLIPYHCSKCKNNGVWNEEILVLELDHINGIRNDNRIENLRFLCPNCHSQTDTNKGKNCKGVKKKRIKDGLVF